MKTKKMRKPDIKRIKNKIWARHAESRAWCPDVRDSYIRGCYRWLAVLVIAYNRKDAKMYWQAVQELADVAVKV